MMQKNICCQMSSLLLTYPFSTINIAMISCVQKVNERHRGIVKRHRFFNTKFFFAVFYTTFSSTGLVQYDYFVRKVANACKAGITSA